jgi:hypothetical protein
VFQQADAALGILHEDVDVAQRHLFAAGEGAEEPCRTMGCVLK